MFERTTDISVPTPDTTQIGRFHIRTLPDDEPIASSPESVHIGRYVIKEKTIVSVQKGRFSVYEECSS